jgi:hypothetical protein
MGPERWRGDAAPLAVLSPSPGCHFGYGRCRGVTFSQGNQTWSENILQPQRMKSQTQHRGTSISYETRLGPQAN